MNALKVERQQEVLKLLIEGNSLSGTSRITGVHLDTCSRLMVRFGKACQEFLDREIQDLELRHVQIDEVWTFCRKKQRRITGEEPDADRIGDFYVFVALDEDSRLVPAHVVGRRDEATTKKFVFDLAARLKWSKDRPVVTRISSDAFPAYEGAVEEAFGASVEYGQIVKVTSKEGVDTTKRILSGQVAPDDVTTSLVERNNLTTRTFMKRLTRRSIGYSKKFENLVAATAMHMCHYNYCWRLKTLKSTPAMAAGLCNEQWDIGDLYEHVRACSPQLNWGRQR